MSWIEQDGSLVCTLKTKDFLSAFRIVEALVEPAEALNHHPDIAFGWGYVRISLTTHDAGGLTPKDRELAARLDQVLAAFTN